MEVLLLWMAAAAQFTCFTSTKVPFTSTKVQILTQKAVCSDAGRSQFTCFTSTKVQILTRRKAVCSEGSIEDNDLRNNAKGSVSIAPRSQALVTIASNLA